jgi:tungstate transport system ATP-binding protein
VAESLLALRDILVRHGDHTALEIGRLQIEPGEVLALLGPNGAGKTTLLRLMGLLQLPNAGTVYFKGAQVDSVNALAIRRRMANVFQEPLLINATLYQNAALGLKLRGVTSREIEMRLCPWLDRLRIAHLRERSARTLSGGEAQRASLARALVLEPELLLLDEPFSALDSASRENLLTDFQRIIKEIKITTVFVTHDRSEAFELADRIGVLKQGRLLQLGSREEVFLRPQTEAVAEIVGIENRLSGIVESLDGNYVEIAIGGAKIRAVGDFQIGAPVILCVRADHVSLEPVDCKAKTRNCFDGRIVDVSTHPTQQQVAVDCGSFRMVALIARKQSRHATLLAGESVTVTFSPLVIHPIMINEQR